MARAYGVISGDRAYASRWTCYIGKDGRILHIDKQVSPATAGRDVVERLKELGLAAR